VSNSKFLLVFRYLVFFDDGYAQYVHPHDAFPVVESSPDIWLDVHPNSRDFIHDYVKKYPNRHMIRGQIGAAFNVELNGMVCYILGKKFKQLTIIN